jgi:hypothetical protein
MLYLFELMANASLSSELQPPIKEPNVRSATVSGTAASFAAFRTDKNWGHQNGPTRPGTFGQANAKAYAATK